MYIIIIMILHLLSYAINICLTSFGKYYWTGFGEQLMSNDNGCNSKDYALLLWYVRPHASTLSCYIINAINNYHENV